MTIEEQYRLSCYEELTTLGNHNHIYLVKHKQSGEIFVKKILFRFSFDVYEQLKTLNIAGIPKIHEMISDDEHLILIEDYIHGHTLEQALAQHRVFSENEACRIVIKLCRILKSLHKLNPPIIHRDLKLSNIILTNEGMLCLVDFDTARYYESDQEQDTQLLGTREYAPPEQYGFGQSDTRSDIYALGIILNRLLTGEYPKHQMTDKGYRSVISKCIRWEPEERFQSIEELETSLAKYLPAEICTNKPVTSSPSFKPPGFRTGTLWKMILASFGYLFCFYLCLTITFTETKKSVPITGSRLWYERCFMLLILLSLIFYNCDYGNIRSLSFQGRSFPLWIRILIQVVFSLLIVIFFVLIMLIFEEIIW